MFSVVHGSGYEHAGVDGRTFRYSSYLPSVEKVVAFRVVGQSDGNNFPRYLSQAVE